MHNIYVRKEITSMKKLIAIISVLVIAASMTACASDNGTNGTAETTTATTTVAETESATEATTEATEAETTVSEAEAIEESAPKAEDDTVESIDDVFANRADGLWMVDLTYKAMQWPYNVKISVGNEMDGTTMEALGEKYISKVKTAGVISSVKIFDGTNTYIVDDEAKDYCIDTVNAGGIDAYLLAEEDMESFTDAGIEEIDGTKYIYEEYVIMDIPTRYYFDEFGNAAYYSFDADGEKTIMTYTVEFADEADESVFAVPADYTEISYDDYKMKFAE